MKNALLKPSSLNPNRLEGDIGMNDSKITCDDCSTDITEYYHDGYKGKRGKCPKCGIDFPLE